MSVIKKKPFIEKVIDSLTDAQKTSLGLQINASGNSVENKTISQIEDGIHSYLLKLDDWHIQNCICIKTDDYEVALGYGNKQVINVYNLDTEVGTYTEIKEHCSIEELRRIVFGGGGGGGTVTPEELDELIDSGDDEVVVDLNADETKLLIALHAKKVTISSPSTATSGTLTSAQLAALKESRLSYIVFDKEIYNLYDDGHVTGSLGYSHIGVENGRFMIKNITITESTLGWVLTNDNPDFVVSLTPTSPDLTSFDVTSNNYSEEIKAYTTAHNGALPNVCVVIQTGASTYTRLPIRAIEYRSNDIFVEGDYNQIDSGTYQILQVSIQMEDGNAGTTEGQSISVGQLSLGSLVVKANHSITVDGWQIPQVTADNIVDIFEALSGGSPCVIKWQDSPDNKDTYFSILGTKGDSIYVQYGDLFVIEYTKTTTTTVEAKIIQSIYKLVFEAPTAAAEHSEQLNVAILDEEPTTEYDGWLYFIKE